MKYQQNEIVIESPFAFAFINKIKLSAKVNEHIQLELWAALKPEEATDVLMQKHANKSVMITLSDDQNYFTGLITKLDIEVQSGFYMMYLCCSSATILIDSYRQSSSYQDIGGTYADLLKTLYKREQNAHILTNSIANTSTKIPLIQYQETLWEFTLRMAGNLSTYVIADSHSPYPRVILGTIKRPEIKLDEPEWTAGYSRDYGICYQWQSLKQLELGDIVVCGRYKLTVVEKKSVFTNGRFENEYLSGTDSGYAPKPICLQLSGLRLKGTVLDVQGEKLKLHLDIDDKQDLGKAFWFDYSPQTGNVMYSTPKTGEKALLRFCTNDGSSCIAEECWRENSEGCSALDDYHKRYLTTEFGKQMAMLPDALFFNSDGNQIQLSDHSGIYLKTGTKTRIIAKQGVLITANKKIRCETPKRIYIAKPGTKSVVECAGTQINIESTNTTVITTMEPVNKAYSLYTSKPTVLINRRLALTALSFIPQNSGRRE